MDHTLLKVKTDVEARWKIELDTQINNIKTKYVTEIMQLKNRVAAKQEKMMGKIEEQDAEKKERRKTEKTKEEDLKRRKVKPVETKEVKRPDQYVGDRAKFFHFKEGFAEYAETQSEFLFGMMTWAEKASYDIT